jgi:tetratricopeptide (TPR) repeat protein
MTWKMIVISLILFSGAYAQEETMLFEQANQLYRNGEYRKAVSSYEQIVKNGYENAPLYYNLGNAYFKLQNIPASILNFERAKKLAPTDEDINYNLRLANLRVIDKVEPIPRLFFINWWNTFLNLFSSAGWAVAGIVALWIAVILGAFFLIAGRILIQRISFFIGIIMVLFAVLSFIGMYQQLHITEGTQYAIVFSQSVAVKSAPDAQSTDLFVLHEGVKVEFLDTVGEWRKVRLADGKIGWLPVEHMQII